MIKLIIFDLDGVLIDAKKIHYDCLNQSLAEVGTEYEISWEDHLKKYDGLKTYQKLQMLTDEKKLPQSLCDRIWKRKQYFTIQSFENLTNNYHLIEFFTKLSESGYLLGCCSNSIRKTVFTVLSKLGIIQFFDLVLSNEDVQNGKPHPEIYWKAMSKLNCLPEETLIIEDSPYGLISAQRSKAHVLRVKNTSDVNIKIISEKIIQLSQKSQTTAKWVDNKMNVLIPMAGAGSRFDKAGYTFPKPLIEIHSKPMIQIVVENLNIEANYIFVVQKKHREKYNLDSLLSIIVPKCKILEVDSITEGAACTALLAKELIDNDSPLFFANSDQFVEWNSVEFLYKMQESEVDGGIVTFESTHPKWSFAEVGDDNLIKRVAEKDPISNNATVGFYFWKKGSDFVKYAEQMISKNIRVNNEFYVCPVFNQAIDDGKKIMNFKIDKMWGLGTPEDLKIFIKNF